MKPQYIVIGAGVPKVVQLDNNSIVFNVAIRTDATTVEVALEDPAPVGRPDETPLSGSPGPTWVAAPAAAANGIINLTVPARAVRFSKATAGVATVLQQGLV
jgi:hypothetical protein